MAVNTPRTLILHQGHQCFIYDPRLVAGPVAELFAPDSGTTVSAGGRGYSYVVEQHGEQRVLRHYARGGIVRHLVRDQFVFTGLRNTRMQREFRLLQRLRQLALPVPEPVAVRVTRHGMFYRGDILMTRIAEARTLAEIIAQAPLTAARWQAVGACIAQFHNAGVHHADLNAHNIMLSPQQVHLIDFDKSTLTGARQGQVSHPNLQRLQRSLLKLAGQHAVFCYDDTAWDALMKGYRAGLAKPVT